MSVDGPGEAVDAGTRFQFKNGFTGPTRLAEVVNPNPVAHGAAKKGEKQGKIQKL